MRHTVAVVAGLAAALSGAAVASAATTQPSTSGNGHHQGIQHVLLISVDGMHQSDLDWYVANHPKSELARLATRGAEYTDAKTSDPSDSDPGGTALMTGADPKLTGVYYDDEYSHGVFPPGTTNCSGPVPGDRDVPLVVYAPGNVQPRQSGKRVETTQVAPTILKLLGLSPSSLQAVQREGTQVPPGLGNAD